MSKSLGNFFTLRDLLAKGFSGREIRYLLLTSHYRESFNFTLEGLQGARAALARLDECAAKLQELAAGAEAEPAPELLARFTEALDDDLNVSAAWGAVFEWVREQNRLGAEGRMNGGTAAAALAAWRKVSETLGIAAAVTEEVPEEIRRLAEERQAARKAKDFKKSDVLRDELKARGWVVEDTPKGPKFKRT